MYEFDDEDDEEGRPAFWRVLAISAGVVALAAIVWFGVRPQLDDDEPAAAIPVVDRSSPETGLIPSTTDGTAVVAQEPTTTLIGGEGAAEPSTTQAQTSTTQAQTTTTQAQPTTTQERPPTTQQAPSTPPPTVAVATTTSPAVADTPAGSTTAPSDVAPAPGPVTYETLPDGNPAPVIAIFDVAQVTLTGVVPDQAAKDRLHALAIANARPGQADSIANFLTINPAVPRGVGVRIVELTSTRFPEGSSEVLPLHAAELDRIANAMSALPAVTALVIGHADQRGDEIANYRLSAARAEAVANYLVSRGIAPSRVSSRAVGETDLLTLNNDEAALNLNRRTEFVLYGLILP